MAKETNWRFATLPSNSLSRTKHAWNGEPMKPARHLFLAEYSDGPMIYRYADDWQFSGDTWHQNLPDALHQIEFEFGRSNLDWTTISEQEATDMMTRVKKI
jgi:hypothetical protein